MVAGSLWLAFAAVLTWRLAGQSLDDFFITYRYAANLAQGEGFVFNPGERVLGVTEPGLVLLLAGVRRLSGLPIPLLGTLSMAASLLVVALLGLTAGRREGWLPEALIGGTLVLGSSYLWACHGAAAPVVLALLAGAAALAGRRPLAAGLLAGLAVWMRPDAGLGVGLLGLLLWRQERRLPWRYGLAAAGIILLGLGLAQAYFGTVIPNTLAAKRAFTVWGFVEERSGAGFWPAALPLLHRHYGPSWWLLPLLGGAGLAVGLRQGGLLLRALLLFGLAITLAYPLLGVGFTAWYTQAPIVAACYGAALAGGWGVRRLARGLTASRWRLATTAALGLTLLSPVIFSWAPRLAGRLAAAGPTQPYEAYRSTGRWIAEHTDPGQRVAALEVGTLAYFSTRPVDDLLGLVTPASLPWVERRDLAGNFWRLDPEVLVVTPGLEGILGPLRAEPRFTRRYQEVARFEGQPGQPVMVFRRRVSLSAPSRSSSPAETRPGAGS